VAARPCHEGEGRNVDIAESSPMRKMGGQKVWWWLDM